MSGYSYLIHMALAASMGEPPPIATIQSGWNACITAAPFITVSTDGSLSMPSMSFTSKPASLRYASARCRNPPRRIEPPPTQMTARAPLRVFRVARAPLP